MAKDKRNSFLAKLRNKYRLIIYNDDTFSEVWFIKLTPLNLLAILGTSFVAMIVLFYVLIAYTSVRELIPGYPTEEMRLRALKAAEQLDSLSYQIALRDQKLQIISDILSGKPPSFSDTSQQVAEPVNPAAFHRSLEDSLLRQSVEEEDKFSVIPRQETPSSAVYTNFTSQLFFSPVRGIVTNSFDPQTGHYGTDIVCQPGEGIKSMMSGTVLLSAWTIETGYLLVIQHPNNLVSVYKHNAELLKQTGNMVKAGEVIAIVGNSGEYTSGPHLHFELWHNGIPVNPEDYILF